MLGVRGYPCIKLFVICDKSFDFSVAERLVIPYHHSANTSVLIKFIQQRSWVFPTNGTNNGSDYESMRREFVQIPQEGEEDGWMLWWSHNQIYLFNGFMRALQYLHDLIEQWL